MDIPSELWLLIINYLSVNQIKCFSLVNKKIRAICRHKLFVFPKLYKAITSKKLRHLPIRIIKLSNCKDLTYPLPNLNTIILDSRKNYITPNYIKKNPNILFLASLDYVYPPDKYHFLNFNLKNFKLFTNSRCWITLSGLLQFKDFTFQHICLSHIEDSDQVGIFTVLSHMNVERLHIDQPIQTGSFLEKQIINLKITFISASHFYRYGTETPIFPLHIINQIKTLEILHMKRGIRFKSKDLQNLKYNHINVVSPTSACIYCGSITIYKKSIKNLYQCFNEFAIIKQDFLLYTKRTSSWVHKFERDYTKRTCSRSHFCHK